MLKQVSAMSHENQERLFFDEGGENAQLLKRFQVPPYW